MGIQPLDSPRRPVVTRGHVLIPRGQERQTPRKRTHQDTFQIIDGTSTKPFLNPWKHGVVLLFRFSGFGSLDVALELIHRRMVSPVIWTEESVLGGGRF